MVDSKSSAFPFSLSYSIGRGYPYRWFLPLACLSFLIITPLITVIYFASTGYDMVVQTSSNPNGTISANQRPWHQRLAAAQTDSLTPTCEPSTISVNSLIFTSNLGLTYLLTNVSITYYDTSSTEILPALPYHNQKLQNCTVSVVQIDLDHLDRTPNQVIAARWGSTVYALAGCQVVGEAGVYGLSLRGSYNLVPETFSLLPGTGQQNEQFVSQNLTARAAMWWGESLLSAWWTNVSTTVAETYGNYKAAAGTIQKGLFEWVPNELVTDITDLDSFKMTWAFITNPDSNGEYGQYHNHSISAPGPASAVIEYGDNGFQGGKQILFSMDRLARVMYSTVLADLGQPNSTPSNLLTDPNVLAYFSEVNYTNNGAVVATPGPAKASYANLTAQGRSFNLTISEALISTTYLCEVPEIKSAGEIVLSILVADIVFCRRSGRSIALLLGC